MNIQQKNTPHKARNKYFGYIQNNKPKSIKQETNNN